ncbi:CrcB family protein [Isoptericola sp. b408]|uniref:fluoride efflux transporter FluC n=1 Tax=Isoptericola sp. b408 TaxID=3064653 RepID=UPI0027139B9A|nr:CrcB family protein [Isoptericola sp. b408]MDO8149862.1 CrcB family protein [Isoptericola sp. b408]
MAPDRHPHRDVRLVALVAAGGAVGSVARYGVSLALPPGSGGWPWATLAVNVLGAFLLGWLLEAVARRGLETPRLRRVRLFLGTGLLGGFTTYSALALEATALTGDGAWPLAVAYVAATLVLGTLAALLGILLGLRTSRSTFGRLLHPEEGR